VETVELMLRSEKPATEIARDLGIRPELLYRWKSEYQTKKEISFPGTGHLKDPEEERLRKLERELRSVTEERDILKKQKSVTAHWRCSHGRRKEVPVHR
jgi:transposase